MDFMQRQKNSAIARKQQAILERHNAKEMAKQSNMNGPDMPGASAMSAVPTGIPGAPAIPGIVPPAMPGAPAIPGMPSGNSPSPFEIKMPPNPMDAMSEKLNKPLKSMFEFKATPYKLLPNQGKVTEEDPTAKAAIGKISDVIVDDIETSEKKKNLIGKGLFQKLINSIDVDEFKKQLGPMVKKELNAIYENNSELQEALCKIWILAFRTRTYPVFNAAFETMSGKALNGSDKLNKQVANNANKPGEISVDVPEEGDEHEDGESEDSEQEDSEQEDSESEDSESEDSESKNDVASKITTSEETTLGGATPEKKMTGGQKKMTNSHIYDVFIYYKREFLESIIDKRAIFNSASYQTIFNSQKSLIAKMVRHYAIVPRDILLGKLSKLIVGVEDFKGLAELDEAPAGDDHLFGIFNGILSELINKKLRQPGEYDSDEYSDNEEDDADEEDEEVVDTQIPPPEKENADPPPLETKVEQAKPLVVVPSSLNNPSNAEQTQAVNESQANAKGGRAKSQKGGSKREEEKLIKMREQIMKLWNVSQKLKRVSKNRHKTPQLTDAGNPSRVNPRTLTAPRPPFFAISRGGGGGGGDDEEDDEEGEEDEELPAEEEEAKVYDDENLSTRPRYMPASYDWYYIEKKVADDLEKYIIMLFKQSENQIKDVFRNVCKQYNAAYLNDYSETSIMRQYAQEEFNNMLLGFCENINNNTAEQILYHCAFGPKFDDFEEAFAGDVFGEENHPSIIESIIGYGRIVKKFFETDVFKLDIPTRTFENIATNAKTVVDSVKETVSEREPEDNDEDANEEEDDDEDDDEESDEESDEDDDEESDENDDNQEGNNGEAKVNDDQRGGDDKVKEGDNPPPVDTNAKTEGREADTKDTEDTEDTEDIEDAEDTEDIEDNEDTEDTEHAKNPTAKSDKKTKELPDFIKFNFDSKKYKDAFTAWPFSYKWEPAILKVAYKVLDEIFYAALQDTVFLGEVFAIYSNSALQFMQDIVEDFKHHKNKLKVYVENYVILKNPHVKTILTKCMDETVSLWLTKKAEECDPKHLAIYTLFLLYFYLSSSEKKLSWNTHTETGEVKEDEEPDNEVPVDNEELGNEVPVGNDETEASGDNKEQQSKPHIYNPIDKTINNAIREFSDIFLNGQTEILDHFRSISNESTLQFEYNQFFVKAMKSAEESVEEESTQEESNADGEQQGGGQKKTKYRRPKSKHRTLRRKSGRRFIGK